MATGTVVVATRTARLGVVRLAWSAVLFAVPGRVLRATGGADTPDARRVVRVLAARHAVQGLVELCRRKESALGVAVDAAHAASMVALAAAWPRWRRPAAASAGEATAFAGAGERARRAARGAG